MSQHARLRIDTGLQVYFCDWHKRKHQGAAAAIFPQGKGLSVHSAKELEALALALNTRPRKTLDWRTPAEALNEVLRRRSDSSSAF